MLRCSNCMKEYEEEFEVCPHCGYIRGTKPKEPYHLQPEMVLTGKYVIGTVIGFGGFGVIYKAWDKNLEKVVAVKEYYPTAFLSRVPGQMQVHVYDKKNVDVFEKGKREFLEEARNMAKFNNHPNIVHVFDFFEENGTAYFVMEYLDGCNLKTFLQINKKNGKRLSVDTALQIIQSVLSALKATHVAKIIHRDIKPANIYICKDGTIKVIDFGAARFSDSEAERTRTIIITPGYAPAEQYQTKSKQGPYTDIYAVGAVLYEMLTGIKPEESITRKVEDTVVEPNKVNPEVPMYVNSAVMRAMAIQPEIRFQNVEQFSRALRSGKEVRDAKKEIRYRNRRRILRITSLLLLILVGVAFCLIQYQEVRREAILESVTLTVWLPYKEDGSVEEAQQLFENMSTEFLQNNVGIELQVQAFSEADYEEELKAALNQGTGPVIFDSSCLETEDYAHLAQLEELFSFSLFDATKYYFLDNYAQYYPSEKQLPLTFNVPVLYENSLLKSDTAENINVENNGQVTYEDFADQTAISYMGTEEDYRQVQEDLPGIYILTLPEDTEGLTGTFTNLWSIREGVQPKEMAAAIRLMYYLLSDTAQDYLTVQNDNNLPLNRNVMTVFLEVNGDFDGMEEYIDKLTFVGEME